MTGLATRLLRILILTQASTGLIEAKEAIPEDDIINIIVEGNEARTISNTTLNIEGRIEVRDNATLILENVTVRFTESETEHSFAVNDNASLVLINSDVKLGIDLNQNSSLTAFDTKLYYSLYCPYHGYNHTYGGIRGNAGSSITLNRCKIGYLWLRNNSQAQVTNSYIYRSFQDGGKLTAKNSKIQASRENINNNEADLVLPDFTDYTGELGKILTDSSTYFENVSLIDGIWLNTYNSTIKICDSKLYYLDTGGNSDIQLNNASLFAVNNYGDPSNLKFTATNCNITRFSSYGSNDNITIKNSKIENLLLAPNQLELNITNTRINNLQMDDIWFKPYKAQISPSTIGVFSPGLGSEEPNECHLHNVTLTTGLDFTVGGWSPTGGINLYGDFRFGEDFSINKTVIDGYAIINRFYPVICSSASGPVANVSLRSTNSNQTLWEGETNSMGYAEIPVRFVYIFDLVNPYNASGASLIQANNLTDTVSLFWSKGEHEGSIEFSLTSQTPLQVEIPGKSSLSLLLPILLVLLILLITHQSKKGTG